MLLLLALPAQAQNYPDYQNVYVNDYANILPAVSERSLRVKLEELKEARDIEFTVLTIRSMQDYGHQGAIEPFATGLFNEWGIGNADRNDGILLLVASEDRRLRIELGSGYSRSLDPEMKRIIDRTITPEFKENRYFDGIDDGVNEVILAVTGRFPGEYDASPMTHTVNSTWRFIQRFAAWFIAIGTPIGAFLGFKAYKHIRRTRRRICSRDGSKMYWMTDEDEKAYLTEGQQVEERLKSVDYDVWGCRQCDEIQIETYKKWFSGFKQCPKCSYKTQTVTTTTMSRATEYSTGMRRTTHTCNNCGHNYARDHVIPVVTVSSSSGSSSSSGGSFGGGSSSGGGASGSW